MLSARHSAIEVSSVHAPAGSENGPPPTMSVTGGNVPGGENSTVVPTASPTARPNKHPRKRSLTDRRLDAPAVQHPRRRADERRAVEARGRHVLDVEGERHAPQGVAAVRP